MKKSLLNYIFILGALNYGAGQITSVNPVQNALDIYAGTNISATFDTIMDQLSINDTTFIVQGSASGIHLGIISYDPFTRTATLNPAQNFLAGEIVTAMLTRGIRKASGVPIPGFIWNFTISAPNGTGILYDPTNFGANDGPYGIKTALLNGDNFLDLIVTNVISQDFSVLFGAGDGTFSTPVHYATGAEPIAVAIGDLDNDGDDDCVVACQVANEIWPYLNNGSGIFSPAGQLPTDAGPFSIYVNDLNADGYLDAAVTYFSSTDLSVFLGNGDGTFQPRTNFNVNATGSVYGGDFDHDGDIDLAVTRRTTNQVRILANDGQGSFQSVGVYGTDSRPNAIFCGSLNSADYFLDIATANTNADNVSVLLSIGDSTFAPAVNCPFLDGPVFLLGTDLDTDGDLDLVVSNAGVDSLSIAYNNDSANFSAPANYYCGDSVARIAAGDFNNDGTMDIAVSCFNEDSVVVFLNYGDTIPPGPPQNPTANGSNPSPWTNNPAFLINWTNPPDFSGISQALYKLGAPPVSNFDTTGTMAGTPPDTAQATVQGGQVLYLWLQDKAGNLNYQNNATVLLRYENIPPAGSNASSPLFSTALNFSVNWTAGSDSGGSGLTGRYDVKVRDNSLPWTDWLTDYAGLSATYLGADGHKYYFEAACRDSAGNVETFSSVPECSTIVDTTKPAVISHYPASGDTNIPTNAVISAKFSEPMDSSTMITGNFSIVGTQSGNHAFSISYTNADTTVFLDPGVNFAPLETVTVTVRRQVEDLAGNLMPADVIWQFSTSTIIDTIGPLTSSANALPNPAEPVANITITALVNDAVTGNNIISSAEFFIDTIGLDGTGNVMLPIDSLWDETSENIIQLLNNQPLNWAVNDTHAFFVHGRDAAGNWGGFDTALVFIVPDDDTLGPVFSSFSPVQWTDTSGFYIECQITDPSGVYDDATGSSGQGIYLLWDNDGEIIVDAYEATMSFAVGSYYRTDSLIPVQSAGVNFVYRVSAYDNDYDTQHEGDRTQGFSSVQSVEILDVRGPSTSNTVASPNPTAGAVLLSLASLVSDSLTGASSISSAEYFIDMPGADSTGVFLHPADGFFDEIIESVVDTLDISSWAYGTTRKMFVHGLDTYGNWGKFDSVLVQVTSPEDTIPPIIISTIPDSGQTNVNLNASVFIAFSEPLDTASLDTSKFHITGSINPVYDYALAYDPLFYIVSLDPLALFAANETVNVNVTNAIIDTNGNSMESPYTFYFVTGSTSDTLGPLVTAKNAAPDTTAGAYYSDITATISDSTTGMSTITTAELFIDSTGAAGTGQPMAVTDSIWDGIAEQTSLRLDITALSQGIHWLFIHGKDATNNWGNFDSLSLYITPDDDTVGPLFSNFWPDSAPDTAQFYIFCTINDSSGIYDDSTGAGGQGVYLLWDIDGELMLNAYEKTMSLFAADTFRTDNAIPAQAHTVNFVYEVHAYDNDYDFNDPLDRTRGQSGVQTIDIYDARGPVTSYLQVSPPNPPAGTTEIILYAMVSDSLTGQLFVAQAEAFLDSIGATGTGYSMLALDGLFDEIAEDVFDTIPVSGWLAGQSHKFFVHGRDGQGNWGGYDSITVYVSEVVDTIPPTIASTVPDSAATDVPLNTWIYITFNEKVDPATVTSEKFLIDGSISGAHGFWMSYTAEDSTVSMNPYIDFAATESVTVYVASGISDLAGNVMTSSYQWWFLTGLGSDTTRPVISSMNLNPDTVWATNFTRLDAVISDDREVAGGEYFIDSIGVTGTGYPVTPTDSFGHSPVVVFDTIFTTALSYGRHMVYLHGADAAGNWSWFDSLPFFKAGGDTIGPSFTITIDPSPAFIGDTLTLTAIPNEPLHQDSAVICSVWTSDTTVYTLVLDLDTANTYEGRLITIGYANGNCRVMVCGHDVWSNYGFSDTTFSISPGDEFLPEDDVYAWPNPAHGNEVNFHYYVNANADVTIDVFTITGKRIARLEGRGEGGRPPHLVSSNAVVWNTSSIASDIYLFKISATSDATGEKKSWIKKFAIVK